MSKKKSYMDRKNILNEGIITYALEKLFKIFVEKPALKNSKKVKKATNDLNGSLDTLEKSLNDELKSMGSKKRVKLKRYKSTSNFK
tara:strand:+ start:274 stop:531 length:258 start_codon:yes stop_codon:yes gene_type:complete